MVSLYLNYTLSVPYYPLYTKNCSYVTSNTLPIISAKPNPKSF